MQYRLRLVKDSNNRVAAIPTVNSESTPSHAPQLDALSRLVKMSKQSPTEKGEQIEIWYASLPKVKMYQSYAIIISQLILLLLRIGNLNHNDFIP